MKQMNKKLSFLLALTFLFLVMPVVSLFLRSACQLDIKLTQSFFVALDPHFSQDGNVF